jgi:hypothetical protein
MVIRVIRFVARCIATPVFVFSFGVCWLGFILFMMPMFAIFSFLQAEEFDCKDFIRNDCNEFFCEPLRSMWGEKAKP